MPCNILVLHWIAWLFEHGSQPATHESLEADSLWMLCSEACSTDGRMLRQFVVREGLQVSCMAQMRLDFYAYYPLWQANTLLGSVSRSLLFMPIQDRMLVMLPGHSCLGLGRV